MNKNTQQFYESSSKQLLFENTTTLYVNVKWKAHNSSSCKLSQQYYLSKIIFFEEFVLIFPSLISICTIDNLNLSGVKVFFGGGEVVGLE